MRTIQRESGATRRGRAAAVPASAAHLSGWSLITKLLSAFVFAIVVGIAALPVTVEAQSSTPPLYTRISDYVAGVVNYRSLSSLGFGSAQNSSLGAAYAKTVTKTIAGTGGATDANFSLTAKIVRPVANLVLDTAAFCFTGPVQATVCSAGVIASYLAIKGWSYDAPTAQWERLSPTTAGTCTPVTGTLTNYQERDCFSATVAASSTSTRITSVCGSSHCAYDNTYRTWNAAGTTVTYFSNYHRTDITQTINQNSGNWSQNSTATYVYAPSTQQQMAADIQDAGTTLGQGTNGYGALANALDAQGVGGQVNSTDPASVSTSNATALRSTSPTTTETIYATPSGSTVADAQVAFTNTAVNSNPNVDPPKLDPWCGLPGLPDCEVAVDEKTTPSSVGASDAKTTFNSSVGTSADGTSLDAQLKVNPADPSNGGLDPSGDIVHSLGTSAVSPGCPNIAVSTGAGHFEGPVAFTITNSNFCAFAANVRDMLGWLLGVLVAIGLGKKAIEA